ncbi:hypothetical protein ACRALDRAFT_1080245 [Sodiomyces alcalophilus JCM 7366]|uniref:uncharacterized protein n=1 Tax=Sodiomyces alcalophilus JCM 7366 TaxID=591952 RepID=UPI0039B68329
MSTVGISSGSAPPQTPAPIQGMGTSTTNTGADHSSDSKTIGNPTPNSPRICAKTRTTSHKRKPFADATPSPTFSPTTSFTDSSSIDSDDHAVTECSDTDDSPDAVFTPATKESGQDARESLDDLLILADLLGHLNSLSSKNSRDRSSHRISPVLSSAGTSYTGPLEPAQLASGLQSSSCTSFAGFPGVPKVQPPNPVPDQDLIATTVPRRKRPATRLKNNMVKFLRKNRTNSTPTSVRPPDAAFSDAGYAQDVAGTSESPTSSEDVSAAAVMSSVGTGGPVPNPDDFKKTRASTGFSLRGRVIGFGQENGPSSDKDGRRIFYLRRRRSFHREPSRPQFQLALGKHDEPPHHHHHHHHHHRRHRVEPSPWSQMPDAGVGVKSRRLSVSLPDDFFVEVADLLSEYEYHNKFFGRHGRHLGKGATSKVALMARKGFPDELYAVKEFRRKSKSETADEYEKKVKSEYSIAKSLHHPNIVETVQLCTDHGRWNHVMEYCANGDLYQLVEKGYLKDHTRLSDRLCLFKQVVQGVNYLHSNGIAHRDIKLENCLISAGSKLKITDFGVSEVFCGTHPGLREAGGQCGKNMNDEIRLCSPGICGSEPYIAPEVLRKDQPYDPRGMDVWGTAVLMIYLTFGANIWKRAELNTGSPNYDLLVKQWDKWYAQHEEPEPRMVDTDYPHYLPFDQCISPPALRRVLLMMLNPDPAKRASISDILNHRWVKNIECCQLDSYDDPAMVIDASKKDATIVNGQKIFCHNHMPIQSQGHSLGRMPGQPGY